MRVFGHEISDELAERALNSFPPARAFELGDLCKALARLGVPNTLGTVDRAADRILQRARKAGTHAFSGGKWRRLPTPKEQER
jgi:hypothetical protein